MTTQFPAAGFKKPPWRSVDDKTIIALTILSLYYNITSYNNDDIIIIIMAGPPRPRNNSHFL